MKIALIKAPATYANWYRNPSLGIGYICSLLLSKGYECKIFDAYFHGWNMEELVRHVTQFTPDVAGLTAMTHEISSASKIAESIKADINTITLVGGCHVTALPQRTLEEFPAFDFAIIGEGEHTMLEFIENLDLNDPTISAGKTEGMGWRDNGTAVINPPRKQLSADELSAMPYPAYSQYYTEGSGALSSPDEVYTILSSRGCPYKCAFCMQVLGRKVRRRSADSIIKEMKHAIEKYGTHTFSFQDEIFLFNDPTTHEILNAFISTGLSEQIKWYGLTRANFVNNEIIDLARRSGCVRLDMGVESGDDEILKGVDKRISVQQVRDAVKIIKSHNILMSTYFILGHPNETHESVKKTMRLAVELNTHIIAVGVMVPYPGTRVYEMALKGEGGYRLLSDNWEHYDKYGGQALELDGLSHKDLVKYQNRTLIMFYLKNLRFIDAAKYFWQRRHSAWYFLLRKLGLNSR